MDHLRIGECGAAGCERSVIAKGLCMKHYQTFRAHGDPNYARTLSNKGKTCSVDGCGSPAKTTGRCPKHWARFYRHGNPLKTLICMGSKDEQFELKTKKMDSGCWVWTGHLSPQGYGRFRAVNKTVLAHKWLYERRIGQVPVGMELDHLCRNRACVNPDHLEPVSHRVNCLRGVSAPARNAVKTHCKRGHEFTKDNTYVNRSGGRTCVTCRRDAKRKSYLKCKELKCA